ncbi:hypothetical protein LCGC14_0734450 [marine sediment metagenome]|uniref:Gp5/Type VI secretion system Vgr protein OB-fold domain-containing protein n=1 Tax=marine sediment metagenome TaxID=412755 RepID=A0A0F9STT6_9ZZZZ
MYPGVYRGVIESTEDPEERGRYRVRVHHVHPDAIPKDHLPWAEIMSHSGHGWGDIPHYENGELVWVMFEGGNREYPVLMGGWLTAQKGGTDLPPEQSGDYAEDRRRWTRIDRAGNMIEMSERGDEKHIRLRSGNVELIITQKDNSFTINANGPCNITAKKALVTSEQTEINSPLVTIKAEGHSGVTETGAVNIISNKDLNIFAGVGTIPGSQDGKGLILLGQYKDGINNPRQTDQVDVMPKLLKLGMEASTPPFTSDGRLHTDEIDLEATTKISIKSTNGQVEINVKDANIHVTNDAILQVDNDLTATVTGKATITAGGDAKLESTGGKVDVLASGNVEVDGAAINLGAGAAGKVVTTLHVCAFTGAPHPAGSSKVNAVL